MPTYTYSDPNLPSGSSFYIQFGQDPSTGKLQMQKHRQLLRLMLGRHGACASGLSDKYILLDWKFGARN